MSQADERETVIQWNAGDDYITAWTCDPRELHRWLKQGWTTVVFGYGKDDQPHSWTATIPRRAIAYRRCEPRKATGRPFLAKIDAKPRDPAA